MGKKRSRKSYKSKGINSTIRHGTIQLVRSYRTKLEKLEFLSIAWKKFQNPWITIENPDKSATNRKFIRVRANDYWGNPKLIKEEKTA